MTSSKALREFPPAVEEGRGKRPGKRDAAAAAEADDDEDEFPRFELPLPLVFRSRCLPE